jgi:glycosyltransferase involved in cell wall biosynthesis
MRRYAELTEQALLSLGLNVEVHHLSPVQKGLWWLPGKLDTFYRYIVTFTNARKAARRAGHDELFHLLDGGHGYALFALPRRLKTVCTVHDVMPTLKNRGLLPGGVKSRFKNPVLWLTWKGLMRADRLIAVSSNTRADMVRLGDDENRVSVVHNPLPDNFTKIAAAGEHRAWKDRIDQAPPYLFHISNNNYYKNRGMVIKVFDRLRAESDLCLKLAGNPPDKSVQTLIDESEYAHAIEIVPFPSEDELQDLYRGAAVFLFPSRYEGFGWPPLEAMALGCPVVAGDAPAVNDVCAGGALFAPPDDVEALAGACRKILFNEEIAEKQIRSGQRHAAAFTVERFAKQLQDVYGVIA